MDVAVAPLADAFGVEVRGVDVAQPFDADVAGQLRALFARHHLLVFRDQECSDDDHLRLCGLFGPIAEGVRWVSNTRPGFHPEGELRMHSDYAFTPYPMLGLSLHAMELAGDAAPTRFASNARAAAVLPDPLRQRLAGLRVVHMIDTVQGRDNVRTRLSDVGGDAPVALYPRCARPALWTHPVTGVPLLFVLEQQASHFEGWSCADSDELLDAAFAVLYAPDNVYEHHWRVGDLAVWDNLALQHGRRANPNAVRRSLRRVQMNVKTTDELNAGTGFDPEWRAAHLDADGRERK